MNMADCEKTVQNSESLLSESKEEGSEEEENNNVMNQYGRVKPNKHMGYITSVKKAREDLENIFKLEIEDTKES